MSEKKKPIKLEWQGGLAAQAGTADDNVTPVKIRGQAQAPAQQSTPVPVQLPRGTLRLRRETKGRAGRTVIVLYEFSDANVTANGMASLRALCSRLKEALACGGGCDASGIVLQVDDAARVKALLAKLGLEGKISGG